MLLVTTIILTVSIATAISTKKTQRENESPLYKIRTKTAIKEKIQNIKTRFYGERIFFLPFLLNKNSNRDFRDNFNRENTYDLKNCFTYHIETILCGHCTQGMICDP